MKTSARTLGAILFILAIAIIAGFWNQTPPSAADIRTGRPPGPLAALKVSDLQESLFGDTTAALPETGAEHPGGVDSLSPEAMQDASLEAFEDPGDGLPEDGPADEGIAPLLIASLAGDSGQGTGSTESASVSRNSASVNYLDSGNKDNPGDLVISTPKVVRAGTYWYRFINIVDGGALVFSDANITFWVNSILVENGGTLQVGSATNPVGTGGSDHIVTFNLYGSQNNTGITCKTEEVFSTDTTCGVSNAMWQSEGDTKYSMPGFKEGVKERFYAYTRLPLDDDLLDATGKVCTNCYFGRKVIAVSYGGILRMFGKKGATYDTTAKASSSMTSWAKLSATAEAGATQIFLDRKVDWEVGDRIVVTTTDYLPGHSEEFTIAGIETYSPAPGMKRMIIDLEGSLAYRHNGQMYQLTEKAHPGIGRLGLKRNWVDTRAAVGLLSRNIRIVSKGTAIGQDLPDATDSSTERYFGGHTIARQGFRYFQMRGVEFSQMGQGGRMAHSPVNFHMTRRAPPYSYVTDCSIRDSMNRFVSLRGAQNVDLRRNVGFKSIGHGYVLEDGSETHNFLYANLGVTARPAVDYAGNPRKVPGIASLWAETSEDRLSLAGDYIHPSVFLISNGYNDFIGNMAVGAGTCGACFWFAPAEVGGPSRSCSWDGYAGLQMYDPGTAPIKTFRGNFCSTSPYSLLTIGTTGVCDGVGPSTDTNAFQRVVNPFESYYTAALRPAIANQATLQATVCDETDTSSSCPRDCSKGNTGNCAVNVIDSYTSSFHWAQQNYAAMWLRTNWFLVTDSALTDVQNGGLSMVSGGIYEQVLNQYWGLTRKTVFVGHTQDDNEYALDAGPVSPGSTLTCLQTSTKNYCRLVDRKTGTDIGEGTVYPLANFSVYQRLYNIYDGPVYQESNAFLDIKRRELTDCDGPNSLGECPAGNWLYSRTPGIIRGKEGNTTGKCIFPNAAIGWKQPNGFYYPPAFHSTDLYFDDVDIRHFVIVPVYKPGTNVPDTTKIQQDYCTYPPPNSGDKYAPGKLFSDDYTDVDRQTEINDNDGSLSGLKGATPSQFPSDSESTISLNTDSYFYAPRQVLECQSEQTCLQSPYDFITAVVYPECGSQGCAETSWSKACTTRACYGVPIYRQTRNRYWDPVSKTTVTEPASDSQSIRMMGAETYQRSTMVAGKGTYYIDTTRNAAYQTKNLDGATVSVSKVNVFEKDKTYYFFLIYAKETTRVTFQLYIGQNLETQYVTDNVKMVRVGTNRKTMDNCAVCDDATVLRNPLRFTPDSWPDYWWMDYNAETGILTVLMDLRGFKQDFATGREESCGPPSFCKPYGDACVDARTIPVDVCKDIQQSYLCGAPDPCTWDKTNGKCVFTGDSDTCKQHTDSDSCAAQKGCSWYDTGNACTPSQDICKWAVKASECPSGGCPGFRVKFPSTFQADNNISVHRPAPSFASARPESSLNPWYVEWDRVHQDVAGDGACYYSDAPADYIPVMK